VKDTSRPAFGKLGFDRKASAQRYSNCGNKVFPRDSNPAGCNRCVPEQALLALAVHPVAIGKALEDLARADWLVGPTRLV
jgi:hypothetical protein